MLAIETRRSVALTSRRFEVRAPVRVRRGGKAGCAWLLEASGTGERWVTTPTEIDLPIGGDCVGALRGARAWVPRSSRSMCRWSRSGTKAPQRSRSCETDKRPLGVRVTLSEGDAFTDEDPLLLELPSKRTIPIALGEVPLAGQVVRAGTLTRKRSDGPVSPRLACSAFRRTPGGTMGQFLQLFLDETGDFDEPTEPVAVVGLLLAEPATRRFDEELRARLVETAPHLPWPHHANELSRPIGQLLAPLARGPLGRQHPHELHEAARVLGLEPGAIRPKAIGREGRALEERLTQEAPALAASLHRLATLHREGMRALAGALTREFGPSGIAVVAAYDPPRRRDEAGPSGDRYLTVVEALLRRIGRLLSLLDGAHTLFVSAESREVREPSLGVSVPLQPRHLQAAATRGWGSLPRRDDGAAPVRLVSDVASQKAVPEGYRAGVVLADWIGGQLGWMLRSKPRRPLYELAKRAQETLGLPIVLQPVGSARGLPLPCATGPADRAVESAWAGGASPDLEALTPGWVREQARAWVAEARQRRGGGAA